MAHLILFYSLLHHQSITLDYFIEGSFLTELPVLVIPVVRGLHLCFILTSFITSHFWGSDLFKIHLLLQALWSSTIFEVTYFKIHPVWIDTKIH